MKVSDPIIFGHCVKIFYKDVFAKHSDLFAGLKVNANNGLGDVYDKIKGHPKEDEVKADIMKQYETRPGRKQTKAELFRAAASAEVLMKSRILKL